LGDELCCGGAAEWLGADACDGALACGAGALCGAGAFFCWAAASAGTATSNASKAGFRKASFFNMKFIAGSSTQIFIRPPATKRAGSAQGQDGSVFFLGPE
jgi:hypothetical protein